MDLDRGKALSLQKLYRTGDVLWRLRRALQAGLFRRERELLELPDTIVFYDLTNTWYTGRSDEELLRFGRSKEGRKDPLVTLALSLDGAGFPRGCEVLAGDVSEPSTLQAALRRFEAEVGGGGRQKPTVILDAGIATEENIGWLGERGYGWICVSRETRPAPPEGEADVTLTTSAQQEVMAWKLDEDEGEVRLVAVSEGKQATEEAMLARHRERYEAGLRRLHEGLTIPHHRKRYEKVMEKVGRLRERHRAVSAQYEVDVEKGEGPNATAVVWRRTKRYGARDAGAGSYLLRSSQVGWGTEQIVADLLAADGDRGDIPVAQDGAGAASDLACEAPPDRGAPLPGGARVSRGAPDPHAPEGARHSPVVGRDPHPATAVGADDHHDPGDERTADRESAGCPPPAQLARMARAVGVEPHHHRRRTRRKPDPNTQT